MSAIDAAKSVKRRASDVWRRQKERRPGLAHVVDAYQHYKSHNGDHLAAAITYFSFLAIFPLIFLAVSATGFILNSHPSLKGDLVDAIHRDVPGDFGNTLVSAIDTAISSRAGVGVIGLVGVAFAGLGWVANLRQAIDAVWGSEKVKRNFITAKALDALVLLGLGLGVLLSLSLTVLGSAASHRVVDWVGLASNPVAGVAVKVIGIVLALIGDMLVFGWMLIRLPQVSPSPRVALRTTLLAAVGFEILKVLATFYLARIAQSPTAAALGAVVGVLILIDLISRYLLYCVAWAAVAEAAGLAEPASEAAERGRAAGPATQPSPPRSRLPGSDADGRAAGAALSPLSVAAGLISAGAALGAGSVAVLRRRRRGSRGRPR